MRAEPNRPVFVDEISVKISMGGLHGRASVGRRLRMGVPFGRWRNQAFAAGLTSDALIAPWLIEGAMDGAAFAARIETQLVPEPNPGTVVILDNPSTHKVASAAEALRRARCCLLSLPASPRPRPHRDDLRQAEGQPAPHRRTDLR